MPVRGELLRSLRVSRGWTQAEAARLAHVSDRFIRKAEAGGPLDLTSIRTLAKLYQAPEEAVTSTSRPDELGIMADEAQFTPTARLAKRFLEDKWKDISEGLFEEALVPEFQYHHHESGTIHSREELYQYMLAFAAAFSDIEMVAEQLIDHGDFVAARWRCTVTHTGPWHGLAPTHRRAIIYGASWVRVVNGKFGDAWDFWDPRLLYEQLAAPEPSSEDHSSP